jgi:Uma2 family endonuclease
MTTTLKLQPAITIDSDKFFQICQQNPELIIEENAQGELLIMSPTGGETGRKNAELIGDFIIWNRKQQLGFVFDSSTCFQLPQGGRRSPDVAWVKKERWLKLSPEEREKFPTLCPDFALELLSPSDTLSATQTKMAEYLASGLQLGWLINPQSQQVEIYRSHQPKEILVKPNQLSGENILPNFILEIDWLWESL